MNDRAARPAGPLTPRQKEILRLLCEGKVNKEIARELGIGVGTVKQHVVALFKRLNVRNRAMAVSQGKALLEPETPEGGGGELVEEGILVRRPCVVLSVALPPQSAPETARRFHRTLAGLAYDGEALFLPREGCAGDLLFGVRRASERDIVAALQLAMTLYRELEIHDPELRGHLHGGLTAGMAVVSKRRHGGWSGEAVASPVIAGARELLQHCGAGELCISAEAQRVMSAFGVGGEQPPERIDFDRLETLRRVVAEDEAPLGRETELAELEAALADEAGGVVVLEGETGMGKSTLCRTLVARAQVGGRAELLRALPLTEPAPLCDAADGASLTSGELLERLERPPQGRPELLVVDDFHLLDERERQLILARAAEAPAGRLLLLAGRRLSTAEGVRRIHLRRLADEAVAALLRRLAPRLEENEFRRYLAESAGVPLFATELARAEQERMPLPLLMTIASRLDGFQLDWKLLHTLAQGDGADELASLAEEMGEPSFRVAEAAAAAARIGVLTLKAEGGRTRVAFHHPLIRRAVEVLGVEWGGGAR